MPPAVEEGGQGAPARATRARSRCDPATRARLFVFVVLAFLITIAVPSPHGVEALPTPGANVPIQPGPTDDRNPSLAVDAGGILHVVRTENRSSPRGVYYSRSSDGGLSWTPTVRVDGVTGNASFARITVEREAVPIRGRLYVAYQTETGSNADVWFASSDDGVSWMPPRRIDSAPAGNTSITPSIAASAGRLYAAWADGRDDPFELHVYFRLSTDGGATWGAETRLSSSPTNLQPRIDAKGDTIAVAWRELLPNGPAIAVARSDDAGASWNSGHASMAPNPTANLLAPDVFVDDLRVGHVAWIESPGPSLSHAMYAWSHDGATWSTPVPVDDAPMPVRMRQASVSGLAGTIWVAWDDDRAGDYDTYASWSTDGLTWGDGVVNGVDLRLDDTDRNVDTADDATIQLSPTLRTGGFGVFAVWDDARGGTYDTYSTSVLVSPLVITEIQDTPVPEARVEIYNFGRTPFDLAGATLYAGSSVVDLSALGAMASRSHVVVGGAGADLVAALDMGTEGATVRIVKGPDVLAVAGSGPFGVAPDPLVAESTARFAGTLDYVSAWTRSVASTFGGRNLVPPPNLAPPVVLNEVLFNGAGPSDLFAEIFARRNADLTGYRLVADSVYTFSGGTIIGANPYAFFSESAGAGWWASVDATTDNVYLYDSSGRLLDMFGWTSAHSSGMSATRVASGVGGTDAHDNPSAIANGWAFDSVPSLDLVGLARDTSILTDIGTAAQFVLTATNRQSVPEVINLEATSAMANWPITFAWTDGTPLSDSPLDLDALPDLGLVGPTASVPFLAEVLIPIEAPLGDGNEVVVSASAASIAIARASVTLTMGLYPHFDITRTLSPSVVYVEGSGAPYTEVADITVVLEGAGLPVQIQIPQDVVFQIDMSGSMNDNDRTNIRADAVISYIDAMRVDDRGAVIGFTDVAFVVNGRPLTYATISGKVALRADVNATACSPACNGWTNIENAIQLGNDVLIAQGDPSRPRIEILLTDGQCAPTPCTNQAIIDQAVAEGIIIFTIGLGSGADRTYLEPIALQTGGRYYQATGPSDLLQIYADIGTRINRTAGVDPDPTDATPMVEDALAPYLNLIPGSAVDPTTGLPRPPEFMGRLSDRTILQWNVSRVDINETWAVRYSVTSTRLGVQDVALHPESRATYLRWDGSTVFQTIPQASLEVLAPPTPPTPPVITATTPADGAIGVLLDATITVSFSEDMAIPTVTWTLTPALATTPAWPDARTLALAHGGFEECTLYTVHITSGLDLDEAEPLVPGSVANPWSFTTVCPTYVRYTITRAPEWGEVEVDGAAYGVPAIFLWRAGDRHRIATIDIDPFGGSRLTFRRWDDGGAVDHEVIVAAVDTTIIAEYDLQHPATLTLIGLHAAWPTRIGFTMFGGASQQTSHDAFTSWVDDGSVLDVESLVLGIVGERFITSDSTSWLVEAPFSATIRYVHQFTASVGVEGLDGLAVALEFTAFGQGELENLSDVWTAWVDAGSLVRVDDVLFPSARERYRTFDSRQWRVDAPLEATVAYLHQFRPRVRLEGTDADHVVGGSWRVDREPASDDRLVTEWFGWADAGTTLTFDSETTGSPSRKTNDRTTFTVDRSFDATIRYSALPPPEPDPNWKPILAAVYALLLVAAGFAAGSRALDRYLPRPRDGDLKKRREEFANLTVTEKFDRLTIAEIEEKVAHDRRYTRLLLALPLALAEASIGLLSQETGIFRIPERGEWYPLGFWANTTLLAVGIALDLLIRRRGYRLSEDDLLALAEARARDHQDETPSS